MLGVKWIEREKVELNSLVPRLSLVRISLHELLIPQKNHVGQRPCNTYVHTHREEAPGNEAKNSICHNNGHCKYHSLLTVTVVGGEEEEGTGPSGAGVSTIP